MKFISYIEHSTYRQLPILWYFPETEITREVSINMYSKKQKILGICFSREYICLYIQTSFITLFFIIIFILFDDRKSEIRRRLLLENSDRMLGSYATNLRQWGDVRATSFERKSLTIISRICAETSVHSISQPEGFVGRIVPFRGVS